MAGFSLSKPNCHWPDATMVGEKMLFSLLFVFYCWSETDSLMMNVLRKKIVITILQFVFYAHILYSGSQGVWLMVKYVWNQCTVLSLTGYIYLTEHFSNFIYSAFLLFRLNFSTSHQSNSVYLPRVILNNFLHVIHLRWDSTRDEKFPSLLPLFLPRRLSLSPSLSPPCNKLFSH